MTPCGSVGTRTAITAPDIARPHWAARPGRTQPTTDVGRVRQAANLLSGFPGQLTAIDLGLTNPPAQALRHRDAELAMDRGDRLELDAVVASGFDEHAGRARNSFGYVERRAMTSSR